MAARVLEWNPILVRETRARFRHWGSFALLFAYGVLLAFAMGLMYSEAAGNTSQDGNPLYRMSAVGHQLFLMLTSMQAFAWVLVAPAITAASIAREREDGLLEGVLLSPLAPAKILAGKLLSALSFVGLLILASLPVQSVCFFMGGVSPGEFRAALLLHAVTALTGAMIGLACSAWSRRANIALRSAYVFVLCWLIGSAICMSAGLRVGGGTSVYDQFVNALCNIFAWTNPVLAAVAVVDKDITSGTVSPPIFQETPWLWSVVFQLGVSVALFALSTLALRKPFEAQDEARKSTLQRSVAIPSSLSASLSTPAYSEGSTAFEVQSQTTSDWIEVPGTAQLRFENPVLQRETRGKFRMKAPPLWALALEAVLGLLVGYFYLITLRAALFTPRERETIWWVIAFTALFVVAMASAVMGASTFTREREGQTWNALRLSLLTSGEIINAKIGAILISFAVYSVPFWPLLLPCVRRDVFPWRGSGMGVSPVQAVLSFALVAAVAIAYSLWGMWWSWRCKRTVSAVGWTLGSLFFLLVFFPVFIATGFSRSNSEIIWSFHPFVAMGYTTGNENLALTLICIVGLLLMAAGLRQHLLKSLSEGNET